MFVNIGHRLESAGRCNQGAAVEVDAIGEQQLKWMQSGSRNGCNWGAAAEADAIVEQLKRTQLRAAAEADASSKQQLKRMQPGSSS